MKPVVITTAGDLIIDELIAVIQLLYQFGQKILQFRLGYRHLDVHQCRTVEKTVDMLIDSKDVIVSARTGIIHAVSEPVDTIVHRNGEFIDLADFSIVVP